MTTYRNVNDTEVAVDAPITQQLMQALKDNVLAIQEGDSTASSVRINPKALTKTIAAGDFTILRLVGKQNTQADQTHITIKFKFRIGGTVKIRGTVFYDDTGSNDTATWALKKTASSDSSVTDILTDTDTDGSETYNYNTDVTFAADDSVHFSVQTQQNARVSFHFTLGCDDKDILGQAVLYTDADDSVTGFNMLNIGDEGGGAIDRIHYGYSFI